MSFVKSIDPKVRAELLKVRVMYTIQHPATTDRLYVLGRIEDIINLDYLAPRRIRSSGRRSL